MLRPFRAPAKMMFSKSILHRFGKPATGPGEIVLDLSRLLSRAYHPMPTGIDRVEFIYARELLARVPERLRFAAVHPAGGYYGRLDTGAVRQFLAFTQARWQHPDAVDAQATRAGAIRHLLALRPRPVPPTKLRRIYLQVSPHHLEDARLVEKILAAERARFVTMVHDVIPLTHPEFARPNGAREHIRRIATVAAHSDGIIGNSQATVEALAPYLTGPGRPIVATALLGCEWDDILPPARRSVPGRPYFVCLATIEPRKNHLLLLNVWRRLVERLGDAAPRLVLVGRRGWENENVIDILDRSTLLHGHVVEESAMSDRRLLELLEGARAVLLPSFAEGYGMPLAEALVAGVPVISSDLSALREVGGDVPDYLDPLDGLGWYDLIADYARPHSAARDRQIARMRRWRPIGWRAHFDIVLDLLDRVAARVSDPPA